MYKPTGNENRLMAIEEKKFALAEDMPAAYIRELINALGGNME